MVVMVIREKGDKRLPLPLGVLMIGSWW